ncbi:ribonuclease domain-containing protein [Candidatus Venteria ishoeyi]|uniref:ribonuclease domain-containing protein n=1 Tax=Candidatus Venteria ishoeyi TaxID=1899563 RepID=UPI0025A59E74|nr:ribonuclease domain-containing protein [Candidatus Venteria ishoeyi]MDM8547602.1 ribonuclease domain-containing protein [Candidatus Venteria ishoeyi]
MKIINKILLTIVFFSFFIPKNSISGVPIRVRPYVAHKHTHSSYHRSHHVSKHGHIYRGRNGHIYRTNTKQVNSKIESIQKKDLPPEAIEVINNIQKNKPHPYLKDGSIFGNYEGKLPAQEKGYYKEYTVKTPRVDNNRGERRIVKGNKGELYYTDNHYQTFKEVRYSK